MPADRGLCCHVGGQIEFDCDGNLYLSTGDDTNPFQSAGYTPIDDRATRNPAFDARRTSGNTNDLRGKILRIRVDDRRRLHDPERQPVPARHGADAPGDLRDGHAQPVPVRGQQQQRRRLRRRLLAGRQRGQPGPRAGGPGPLDAGPPAGQLRLAVLRHAGQAVRRLRLHAGRAAVGRGVQLLRGRRTTRATTPACAGCRRWCGRRSGTATRRATRACSPSCSTARRRRHRADGRPGVRVRPREPLARSAGRACSTATRCSTSGRATT